MDKKVIVLLSTYNGEKYVREQLESILHQTYTNLKILVRDDGSTDNTCNILNEYEQQGKIDIIRGTNVGFAQSFFELIDKVEDVDYYAFADQDDVWLPDKVEKTLARMQADEAAFRVAGETHASILVHCDSRIVDRALREIAPSFVAYQKMTPSRAKLQQLLVQNNVVGGALMMNRALAERITEIPAHCVMHDQWIALVASAFGHIDFVPESLYLYRQHGDNVLGAGKGSRIMEILGRFGIGRKDGKTKAEMDAHSQSVYREMFLQAESFRRCFDAELSTKQKHLLDEFTAIPKRSRLGKICTILRYGFTYNLFHRTVGECLFIQ